MENLVSANSPRPSYRDLLAWREARDLACLLFKATENTPLRESHALCDQMRRSSLSVPSNIAEGEERGTNNEALRFLFIAKGSLAELRTQMEIACLIGRMESQEHSNLEARADRVARLISGLIKMRKRRKSPDPKPS